MKVKCLATALNAAQSAATGENSPFNTGFDLTEGKNYLVYGLGFLTGSNGQTSAVVFEIEDDAGRLLSIPAALFTIVDDRTSKLWRAKLFEDGSLTLWPPELNVRYFHDDLSDDKPEAVQAFESLTKALKIEFTD